jgi:carbon storage regulator
MLVLSRKRDEQIMIGDDIQITVIRIDGRQVRLGIDAPSDVRVLRKELLPRERGQSRESGGQAGT